MSAKDHVFTLGIEEEFQIIDPETRELRSHIQQILAGGKMILKEQIKPEMHQSVVELGTEICSDARCARQQVIELRSELALLAARDGLKIASAGTHPFSHRNPGSRRSDRCYESSALLFAAPLRPLGEFSVLVGAEYRLEGVSADDFRAFPTHRNSGRVRKPFRVRRLLEAARVDKLH